ncbi:MAG: chorismate-binding protein [Candidatus Cyclobacteriaceae bacterium M3_2C_046]
MIFNQHLDTIASLGTDQWQDHQIIHRLLAFAFHHNLAVAVWQLPDDKNKHLIIDLSGQSKKQKVDLDEIKKGFVCSPFHNPEGTETLYIKADLHYESAQKSLKFSEESATESILAEELKKFLVKNKQPLPYYTNSGKLPAATSQSQYVSLVEKAKHMIQAGTFRKVVPSRCKHVPLGSDFDLVKTFLNTCDNYPTAFVSLVSTPEAGTWMGASPEILISVEDRKIFKTAAVAGTQPFNPDIKFSDVAWRQKEIEEQALVSRYIINCFKKIRLREFEEYGPKTVKAGKLFHLKTAFRVDMDETNFPQLGTVMLELLHPTSAVCGMPKAESTDFLLQYEQYDRAFYSGYLGPVNFQDQTHLFVNIRNMQLFPQQAIIYAGAGVTIDSDSLQEWEETEMKCLTMIDRLIGT